MCLCNMPAPERWKLISGDDAKVHGAAAATFKYVDCGKTLYQRLSLMYALEKGNQNRYGALGVLCPY